MKFPPALAIIFSGILLKKPYNNSMKNLYALFLLLAIALPAIAQSDLDAWQLPPEEEVVQVKPVARPKPKTVPQKPEEEIVIEMAGAATTYAPAATRKDADTIYIFKYNAKELTNRLAGKSRFYVLFNKDTDPSFEDTIYADNGAQYILVRFGQEGDKYRKFLFEEGGDQKLVAVADSTASVLAVNKKYGVNLGLTEKEFKKSYPNAIFTPVTNAQNGKEYHAYQAAGDSFVVFESGKLVYQFDNPQAFSAYMNTLSAANMGYAAQQAKEQTKLDKARQNQENQQAQPPSYTTLIIGGTVRNPIYLPSIVSTGTNRHALPPLKPSGPPAGTLLIRDPTTGKFINRK